MNKWITWICLHNHNITKDEAAQFHIAKFMGPTWAHEPCYQGCADIPIFHTHFASYDKIETIIRNIFCFKSDRKAKHLKIPTKKFYVKRLSSRVNRTGGHNMNLRWLSRLRLYPTEGLPLNTLAVTPWWLMAFACSRNWIFICVICNRSCKEKTPFA